MSMKNSVFNHKKEMHAEVLKWSLLTSF